MILHGGGLGVGDIAGEIAYAMMIGFGIAAVVIGLIGVAAWMFSRPKSNDNEGGTWGPTGSGGS